MIEHTLNDPTEQPMTGYLSVELVEDSDVLADVHLAPELLDGLDDPEQLQEFGEQIQNAARIAKETDDA